MPSVYGHGYVRGIFGYLIYLNIYTLRPKYQLWYFLVKTPKNNDVMMPQDYKKPHIKTHKGMVTVFFATELKLKFYSKVEDMLKWWHNGDKVGKKTGKYPAKFSRKKAVRMVANLHFHVSKSHWATDDT